MPARSDPIHKVVLKDGSVRWRCVIDVGRKPNGKRDQRCYTRSTKREAIEARAKILADRARGTFVAPSKMPLREHLDEWLAGRRSVKASTRANYANALIPVYEKLGHVGVQDLTKAMVDELVTGMLTSGRRVGKVGKPLSPTTVTLMLTVLRMALADAMKQGIVVRNVAALVDRPGIKTTEMLTWAAEEAAGFLTSVTDDRLAAAWSISMYGLRRGEVLGLRWDDVDLIGKTLTVHRTRSIIGRTVVEGEPKTERGKRTLPLSDDLVTVLTALQLNNAMSATRRATRTARARTAVGSTWLSTRSATRSIPRRTRTGSRCL